jgi:hypothetical protein
MSGVKLSREAAKRMAAATKRVEALPHGNVRDRRSNHSPGSIAMFRLDEALLAATDARTGAAVARATFYSSDPDSPPVMAADRSTYTPQTLRTSTTPRVEWVVNRSLDFTADAKAMGMAIMVNGEWLIFWIDCTAGE